MERQETSFASLQSSDVEIEVEAFQAVKGNLPKKTYSRHFIGYNRDTMRITFICHIRIILETLPFLESLPPNASNTPPNLLQVQGTTKVADPWMEKASAAAKSLTKFHRFREVRLNRLDSIDLHLHLPSYPSSSIMLHDFHPSFQFLTIYTYYTYTLMITTVASLLWGPRPKPLFHVTTQSTHGATQSTEKIFGLGRSRRVVSLRINENKYNKN